MDLTAKHLKQLDPHLSLLLIDHLLTKTTVEKGQMETFSKVKLALLNKTQCNEDYEKLYQELKKSNALNGFEPRLTTFDATCQSLEQFHRQYSKVLEAMMQPELTSKWNRQDPIHNFRLLANYVASEIQLGVDFPALLFAYGKGMYETGDYAESYRLLQAFLALSTDAELILGAMWGSLAASILVEDWDAALTSVYQISDHLQKASLSPLNSLVQRQWLMTWSLFVFFQHPNGRNVGAEFLLQSQHLNTIQCGSQHLLRYVICCALLCRRRKQSLKELLRAVQFDAAMEDPFVRFIDQTLVQNEFRSTHELLRACEAAAKEDYFLSRFQEEWMEGARHLIFEAYSKLHHQIELSGLAKRLCLDPVAGEKWVVKLMKQTKLDAKIDSEKNMIFVGTHAPNVYQQIIEKTKSLSFRTQMLAHQIQARLSQPPSQSQQFQSQGTVSFHHHHHRR